MPRLNEGPGDPRIKIEKGRYSRPQRPMKRCPDGSRRPTYSPCSPLKKTPMRSKKKRVSRAEEFKRNRTIIYK